jgi:septal ring factor EnvC (AmiA/AmiB activator)
MIDTLPQVETRASPPPEKEENKRAGIPFALIAASLVFAVACVVLDTRVHRQSAELADKNAQLAQSNSKAAQANADLEAAKSQALALQAQLVSEQNQRTELESQLGVAKRQIAGFQAQASGDEVRRTNLESQLNSAKAQLAAAQAQVAADQGQRRDLQTQLDAAKAQLAGMQGDLSKAQGDLTRLHPLLVEARRIPITASFEKSYWDRGFTLHLGNTSTQALKVRIAISGSEPTRYQETVLDGGAAVSIMHLPPGEKLVLTSEGFDPLSLTAQ